MRRGLTTAHCLLITAYCLLVTALTSCATPTPYSPSETAFYVYRLNPPAFVGFSADFQPVNEILFTIPPGCGLFNVFPAPIGRLLLIELSCPNGQTVLLLDVETDSATQPITDSDSHFLAWTPDGKAAYLKVDSLGSPHIVRVFADSRQDSIAVIEFTYDLAPSPRDGEFTFTFSRGLGHGSELWLAKRDGKVVEPLYSDRFNYISFARFSPDGSQIALVKIPDTQTPFTVGELWVMSADGSDPRKLAEADAGHGYAANWSPDGKQIAFVVRANPDDARADQSSEALISNIYIVEVESGALTQVTDLENGRAETPFWSPAGNTLAFNVVINDRMKVRIADLATGGIRSLITESTCCPAWLRK
ncbi:MAG: PD40 domain-containing protein [Anaerolineales bacterium]|nr:PD40 domain-containing protein [Anaerolineales bacterium]